MMKWNVSISDGETADGSDESDGDNDYASENEVSGAESDVDVVQAGSDVAQRLAEATVIPRKGSNRFKIEVITGGVQFEAIMDSGAELTCISAELFTLMCRLKKYDIKKSDRRLLDANNDEMPCLGTIDMEFEPYQGAILNGVHGSSKTILKSLCDT